jgi:hypothetical protein
MRLEIVAAVDPSFKTDEFVDGELRRAAGPMVGVVLVQDLVPTGH